MKKYINNILFLFIPLLIINVISLLNMLNAKIINSTYQNHFYKQILWFILGYLIVLILSKINLKKIFKYAKYFYLFSLFLLILVLFVGNDINGAKCWIQLFGISFQPSELMKISLILYLINIYNNSKIKEIKDEFILIIKYIIITIIPSILVFLEPDTGAIINYLIIFIVIIMLSKLNKWWYISFFSVLIIAIIIFFIMYTTFQNTLISIFGTSLFYRMDRLINFANGTSYQLENALITIGSANFFNFNYKDILLYIPEAPTDFIFAFSIGNYGLFSGLLILICFLIIIIYLLFKTYKLSNNNSKMFIYSFLTIFIFHILYNISMNVGLLPIMGIPIPFLSYGGTSTLINFIFLGITLNLFKKKKAF